MRPLKTKVVLGLLLAVSVMYTSWSVSEYFGTRTFINQTVVDDSTHKAHGSINTTVSLLIDFGNGTKLWFNGTQVRMGDDFYNVTNKDVQGNMVSRWYGYPLEAHFVYKILGRGCDIGDFGCKGSWSLWKWKEEMGCWSLSPVGADLLTVSAVKMVAWYFMNYYQTSIPGKCR